MYTFDDMMNMGGILYAAETKVTNEYDATKEDTSPTMDELGCISYISDLDKKMGNPKRDNKEILASIRAGEVSDDVREAAREYAYFKYTLHDPAGANQILLGNRLKVGSELKKSQMKDWQISNPNMTTNQLRSIFATAASMEKAMKKVMKEES
jgi:hypothetical protein